MRKLALGILLSLLGLLFPESLFAQLASQGGEQIGIAVTNNTAIIAIGAPATNFTQTTGTNTFTMGVSQPNTAARIYLTNDTAVACNNAFQITVATTGEKQITAFNNNLGAWQTVPILNPTTGTYGANTGLLSLPGTSTLVLTTAAIGGANAAVIVNNTTGGCGTVNVDIIVLFTSVAMTSPLLSVTGGSNIIGNGTNVQGVVSTGATGTSVKPIVDGGLDFNGNVQNIGVLTTTSSSTPVNAIAIGAPNVGPGSQYTTVTTPNNSGASTGGPLAAFLTGWSNNSSGSGSQVLPIQVIVPQNLGGKNPTFQLVVRDGGIQLNLNEGTVNSNTTLPIWPNSSGTGNTAQFGASDTCDFFLHSDAGTGTTPTLDVWLQNSEDGVIYDDRVHFVQITTAASDQAAGVNGHASNAPHVVANKTLAVGTSKDGPIGPWWQIATTVSGTTPSFANVVIKATCH